MITHGDLGGNGPIPWAGSGEQLLGTHCDEELFKS